jgi:hypothetical protein
MWLPNYKRIILINILCDGAVSCWDYTVSVIDEGMCMERGRKHAERKKQKYSKESPFQWYFIHRNSHVDSPDIG